MLKAGGAYVPLDPTYPAERLRFMLEDSAPLVLLADGSAADLLEGARGLTQVIDLTADAQRWADRPASNPDRAGLTPEHLAYVIYTSGSTGTPKGVMIEHQGLSNLASAQMQLFDVEPNSRVLQFASISFDACVWEVFMALCKGASLHMGSRQGLMPGDPLLSSLRRGRITHVTLPPAILSALPSQHLESLGTLIVAGEACPAELVRQWGHGRRFINAYGPTEATVCASMAVCDPLDEAFPTIGRPICEHADLHC